MTKNQAEAANLEKFRNTSTGEFGNRPYSEPGFTLEADLQAKKDAFHEYVTVHARTIADAKLSAYTSTMRMSALSLAADGINVGHVFFGGDKENWWVDRATDVNGNDLGEETVQTVDDTLHGSGAGYDPRSGATGLDLGELAAWTPPAKPVPGQNPLSDRAQDRIEKALEAAVPPGDPDNRALDLLTDLHHWAARNNVDLDDVYERSIVHFNEEA